MFLGLAEVLNKKEYEGKTRSPEPLSKTGCRRVMVRPDVHSVSWFRGQKQSSPRLSPLGILSGIISSKATVTSPYIQRLRVNSVGRSEIWYYHLRSFFLLVLHVCIMYMCARTYTSASSQSLWSLIVSSIPSGPLSRITPVFPSPSPLPLSAKVCTGKMHFSDRSYG